jgi:hypothetical protein
MHVDYEKIEKAWFTPKEKTAKEMFEELGYKQTKNNNYSTCYKDEINDYYIYIYNYSKKIKVLHDITMQELKAINKQVEELWGGK